jgi:cytosine/uracil/thiamine/allantoin permease
MNTSPEQTETHRTMPPPASLYNEDLAPVPPERRKWRVGSFAALWISMAACIPAYMLASSLIDGGMNWSQALVLGILPSLPGFLVEVLGLSATAVPTLWVNLYHYAWFVGFAVVFATHVVGRADKIQEPVGSRPGPAHYCLPIRLIVHPFNL